MYRNYALGHLKTGHARKKESRRNQRFSSNGGLARTQATLAGVAPPSIAAVASARPRASAAFATAVTRADGDTVGKIGADLRAPTRCLARGYERPALRKSFATFPAASNVA